MEIRYFNNNIMKSASSPWQRLVFPVIICLLACGLYYNFFTDKAYVEIELEVERKTDFKIYWAGTGELYAEKHMAMVKATPHQKLYHFFLTDIGKITRLRLDTHAYDGKATLKKVSIQQEGWSPIALKTPDDFKQLVPLHDILNHEIDPAGLHVTSTGIDPNFELLITPQYQGRDFARLSIRFATIIILFSLIFYYTKPLITELRFVPLLLFGVWALIIVMAGISHKNAHPDEYVHLNATSYYTNHWLPPVIDDPAIRNTYSVYGVSRLNNGEVYYLFAGKFKALIDEFQTSDYLDCRAFNIFLFGIIVLLTIKNQYARMVAIPFLISPQIWYIFSYCNSDAFGLFSAFLASYQLINPTSLLNRYFQDDRWRSNLVRALLLSFLIGMLLLLKKNYYPFVVFFYLFLSAKLFLVPYSPSSGLDKSLTKRRKTIFIRLMVITLAGVFIFGLRTGADYLVNGLDRQEKILKVEEEVAQTWYKPSTELHKKHVSLHLKERGTSLRRIIEQHQWFERSFQTGFGVYGYFTITAPNIYYDLVRWTGVGLLFFILGSILLRGGLVNSTLALSAIGLSAALIGVSLYQSWTNDFQAQGRYLFPILSILGLLYASNHKSINTGMLTLGVTSMYLLGIYSFIFQGLMYIPKIVAP